MGTVVEDGATNGRDRAMSDLADGRLTFTKSDTTETFNGDIVNDPLNELAGTITVGLANPDGATLGMQDSLAVMIASYSIDPEPSVEYERAEDEIREGGGGLDRLGHAAFPLHVGGFLLERPCIQISRVENLPNCPL